MPKRSAAFALALLLPLALPAPAAETSRAFTLEDLYRVKSVGEPAISPDGKTVVYTVATNDWAAKKKTMALWRVDADGTNARPLTAGDANDTHPFFSPDGRTLAFVSTRAGEPADLLPAARRRRARAEDALPRRDRRPALLEGRPAPRLRRGRLSRLRRRRGVQPEGLRGARDATRSRRTSRTPSSTATGRSGRRASARTSSSSTSPRPDPSKALRDLTPGDFDAPPFSVGGGARLRPLAGRQGARVLLEPRRGPGVLDERRRLDRAR